VPDPDVVLILVTLAMAVAAAARPMRLPAPSLLVVAGILVALIPGIDLPRPGPGLVTGVVLPPLLYAAGGEVLWHELRQAWFPVTVLSLGLVLASAFAIGAVVVAVTPVPWTEAVLLGSVLASTDPVAVNALGRGLALPPRLRTVLQAESLFNDATSLVLFRVSLGIVVAGGSVAWGHAVGQFVLLAGGGALVGGAAGLLAVPLRRRITDPILAATAALALPYVVYVLAQQARVSGVAAVVVTGVMLGAQPRPSPASAAEHQVTAVYGTVVFVLESVVFGLIGLELPQLVRALPGSRVDWFAPALAVAATLLVVRLLWVFPLAAVRGRRDGRSARSALPTAAVASWAGARGIVPLAAALSIPLVDDHGVPVGNRALMLALTVGVIAITLIVQGLTLEPLVKRSGVGVAATEASLYVDPIDESDG
jgi:CPA1 family monovalent cation:H+ antiporter